MRGATQAQPGKTLRILYYVEIFESAAWSLGWLVKYLKPAVP
jgi:hypothetical protein